MDDRERIIRENERMKEALENIRTITTDRAISIIASHALGHKTLGGGCG